MVSFSCFPVRLPPRTWPVHTINKTRCRFLFCCSTVAPYSDKASAFLLLIDLSCSIKCPLSPCFPKPFTCPAIVASLMPDHIADVPKDIGIDLPQFKCAAFQMGTFSNTNSHIAAAPNAAVAVEGPHNLQPAEISEIIRHFY